MKQKQKSHLKRKKKRRKNLDFVSNVVRNQPGPETLAGKWASPAGEDSNSDKAS